MSGPDGLVFPGAKGAAMEKTATELKSDETLSPRTIQTSLEKRFDTGYVENINVYEDVAVAKGEKGWEMTIDYDANEKLFGNLSLTMTFKKTVGIY